MSEDIDPKTLKVVVSKEQNKELDDVIEERDRLENILESIADEELESKKSELKQLAPDNSDEIDGLTAGEIDRYETNLYKQMLEEKQDKKGVSSGSVSLLPQKQNDQTDILVKEFDSPKAMIQELLTHVANPDSPQHDKAMQIWEKLGEKRIRNSEGLHGSFELDNDLVVKGLGKKNYTWREHRDYLKKNVKEVKE